MLQDQSMSDQIVCGSPYVEFELPYKLAPEKHVHRPIIDSSA